MAQCVDMTLPVPTALELRQARRRTLPDVVQDGVRVLFCGINPGLYSAAVGHHFGRPGNRFWKALHGSGFTPRLFSPFEDAALLAHGLGITNLCARTTARAEELRPAELLRGADALAAKAARYRPGVVAVLGVGAYRLAFARPRAVLGLQHEEVGGGRVWVLPNPSGLNAHYGIAELTRQLRVLRDWVEVEALETRPLNPPRRRGR
jgi:double-stranded uracil-DNA glycosylase